MERKLVKINTASGPFDVTSFDTFEMYGQRFHVTLSRDNENLFTVSHEGTGFAIDVNSETIENAKKDAIPYLKHKGKEKCLKAIRKSKWFLWKQKYTSKVATLKTWFFRLFYVVVVICALIGSAFIGLWIGGNVIITF